jgi:hypothetical protein
MPWPVACNPSPGLIKKVTGVAAGGGVDQVQGVVGREPDFPRSDFGAGLANPSHDGGLPEFFDVILLQAAGDSVLPAAYRLQGRSGLRWPGRNCRGRGGSARDRAAGSPGG